MSAWSWANLKCVLQSKNLVTGSLDVLETLGKKTFDVINEHDPGLKKARSFLDDRQDKPNLSAILRDAKEQEEIRAQHEKESEEARKAHFGSLFDEFQGKINNWKSTWIIIAVSSMADINNEDVSVVDKNDDGYIYILFWNCIYILYLYIYWSLMHNWSFRKVDQQ